MSLKGQCPRCKRLLDVAVAVVLADPSTGECLAVKGTSPRTVISAGGAGTGPGTAAVREVAITGDADALAPAPAYSDERGFDDDEA